MLNRKKNNKGFTLVELLVVIAIIGILAVVAVPALFKNIEKGKVAELESDISAIRSAALSYYAAEGTYPTDLSQIQDEIESLSDPFEGAYDVNPGNTEQPPAALTLTMTSTKISSDGIEKIENDLGDMFVSNQSNVLTITLMSVN